MITEKNGRAGYRAMYNDYELLSDEELILKLRDGDNRVTEYIIEKYKCPVKCLQQTGMYLKKAMIFAPYDCRQIVL